MISYDSKCNYSHVISDVISELVASEVYVIQVWVDGSELPFTSDNDGDIVFLKEAMKITHDHTVEWILYGTIRSIKVIK